MGFDIRGIAQVKRPMKLVADCYWTTFSGKNNRSHWAWPVYGEGDAMDLVERVCESLQNAAGGLAKIPAGDNQWTDTLVSARDLRQVSFRLVGDDTAAHSGAGATHSFIETTPVLLVSPPEKPAHGASFFNLGLAHHAGDRPECFGLPVPQPNPVCWHCTFAAECAAAEDDHTEGGAE